MNVTTKLDAKKLWKTIKDELQVLYAGLNYDMYISKMNINEERSDLEDNKLVVTCPNAYTKHHAAKNFEQKIQEVAQKLSKQPIDITFEIKQSRVSEKEDDTEKLPLFKSANVVTQNPKKLGINPSYTFRNYIMGNTNQLAFAIAQTISRNPGQKYNPFFIYAGVGLGKTHLIQAIGNTLIKEKPDLNVIYCTGEKFTNELIETLQRGRGKGKYSSDLFRKKYRSADVLIIDDIQFIIGKDATQEEFFHTFNDLYMNNKQIILASDRPPEEFKNIEERITSRFKSGMMADIQPPDYELRTAILRAKRDKEGDNVSNEVISYIAEHVDTNIRELEGAYLRVLTDAMTNAREVTLEVAKEALQKQGFEESNKPVNLNTIMKAVCNYYSVKQSDIKGKRRHKQIVIPRQVAMYLMYEITGTAFMSIGEVLGGRDHTTIMHGHVKIKEALETSPQLRKDIMNIKNLSTTL